MLVALLRFQSKLVCRVDWESHFLRLLHRTRQTDSSESHFLRLQHRACNAAILESHFLHLHS